MSSSEGTPVNGWIVYEPTKGDIAMLNGSFASQTSIKNADSRSWIWRNISDSLDNALQQTDLHYAAPFAIDYPSIVFASTSRNGTYSELALDVGYDFPSMPNSSSGEYSLPLFPWNQISRH